MQKLETLYKKTQKLLKIGVLVVGVGGSKLRKSFDYCRKIPIFAEKLKP